jgi:uncharacterized protein YqeY
MKLKERISADFMTAFKNKETERKNFLGVLKAAIQVEEKKEGQAELTDEDVMKILNKQAKNLNESIALAGDEESKRQLAIVEEYLPQRMSREEVKAKIDMLRAAGEAGNIGQVMKAFALDAVDRKMVAEVFNEKAPA